MPLPIRCTPLRLRDLRHRHKLTQEALATQVGCSRVMISHLERNTSSLSLTLALRLADAFQLRHLEELWSEPWHDAACAGARQSLDYGEDALC